MAKLIYFLWRKKWKKWRKKGVRAGKIFPTFRRRSEEKTHRRECIDDSLAVDSSSYFFRSALWLVETSKTRVSVAPMWGFLCTVPFDPALTKAHQTIQEGHWKPQLSSHPCQIGTWTSSLGIEATESLHFDDFLLVELSISCLDWGLSTALRCSCTSCMAAFIFLDCSGKPSRSWAFTTVLDLVLIAGECAPPSVGALHTMVGLKIAPHGSTGSHCLL